MNEELLTLNGKKKCTFQRKNAKAMMKLFLHCVVQLTGFGDFYNGDFYKHMHLS